MKIKYGLCVVLLLSMVGAFNSVLFAGTSVGVEYRSEYFWRGMSFYGVANSPRGVYFPWASHSIGDLSLMFSGEIASEYIEGTQNDTEEAWLGLDYIATYQTNIMDDSMMVGGRVGYFMYPNSPDKNEEAYGDGKDWRNDFVDVAAWVQMKKLPLKPKLKYSQYFRVSDRDGDQENLKDIYVQLILSHGFEMPENTSLTLGAKGAYFYYPSSEQWNDPDNGGRGDDYKGVSDLVAFCKISVSDGKGLSFYATYNAAYIPDKDFYQMWQYPEDDDNLDKFHNWVVFGTSYSF